MIPSERQGIDQGRVRRRIRDALAEEAHLILNEGAVATSQDIDRCMTLGANFPQAICRALHELTLPARFRKTMAEWNALAGGVCLAQHL